MKIGAIILCANAEDDDLLAHTGHGTGAHWHFRAVWTSPLPPVPRATTNKSLSPVCAHPSFAVLGWGASWACHPPRPKSCSSLSFFHVRLLRPPFERTYLYERHLVVNRPTSWFERPAQTDRPQGGSGRRPRKTADRRGGPVGRSADRGGGRLALEVSSCGSHRTAHTLAAVNKLVSRNTRDTSALSPRLIAPRPERLRSREAQGWVGTQARQFPRPRRADEPGVR